MHDARAPEAGARRVARLGPDSRRLPARRSAAWIAPFALALALLGACSRDPARPAETATHPGAPLLVLVVDTLRADHLGLHGHSRPTSPHLDEWAREARVFEQAWSTAPWTLPAFASLYTGQLPSRHAAGTRAGRGSEYFESDPTLPMLAEVLGQRGYATGAIVNNPYLSPDFGLGRGFDHYDFDVSSNAVTRRADEVVDRALDWIDAQAEGPWFLLAHFFDPHMDYAPPEATRGVFTAPLEARSRFQLPIQRMRRIRAAAPRLSQGDREFIRAAYDEEIAFVDAQLGRLRAELSARGILGRAIVVLTSDHGEELFEHGGFEHGHALWEGLLRVPLLVWGPGVVPGREATPVSWVDLMPTLLEAVEIEPPGPMEGRSLWSHLAGPDELEERAIYAESILYGPQLKAIRQGEAKLILDLKRSRRWLYDLERDPGERRNLASARNALADALFAKAERRFEAAAASANSEPVAVPLMTREKLRSLGYLE